MLPQKAIDEFMEIFEKEYGKKLSNKEATESANNLIGLFELFHEIAKEEYFRKQRLKKEPNGFHLEEGKYYNCKICHKGISGKETWWDKYGIKCIDCQRNLDKGVLPKKACKDRKSWYAKWELKDEFGLHPATVGKLVREKKLKSRELRNKEGNVYFQVFLKLENAHLKDIKYNK